MLANPELQKVLWTRETTTPLHIDDSAAFQKRMAIELRKRVSIVTLSWDQLDYTRDLVASIKANTRLEHEIIIVDNGSSPETVAWVKQHADVAILNPENRGFAVGMNQGLARATGDFVVFINNDTRVPAGWLAALVEALNLRPDVGLVAPAVTNGGGFISVRKCPGSDILDIHPFGYPPPGVCYAMRTKTARAVGGWPECYRVASGEDTDLCYTLWAQGYRILLDERVLIDHVSKGTAAVKLDDWQALWKENRALFFKRWADMDDLPSPVSPAPGLRQKDAVDLRRQLDRQLTMLHQQVDELHSDRAVVIRRRLANIRD